MAELKAFYGFNKLTEAEKEKICNGAGAAGDWRSCLIPNTLWGLNCLPAFDIHDYDYHVGLTAKDKLLADENMLTNILRLIRHGNYFLGFLRRRRVLKYYEAVTLAGEKAFWEGKVRTNSLGYQEARRFDVVFIKYI